MKTSDKGNRELFDSFVEVLYKQKNARRAFEAHVREDYIQHNPRVPDGRPGAIKGLSALFTSFPDLNFNIHRILVDDNLAAIHSHMTKSPDDCGSAIIDIFRMEDGKIVEHWDTIQEVPEEAANPNTMF